MEITRSKELTVRMGDYESFKFKAEVRASHHDLGYSDQDFAGLPGDQRAAANGELTDLIAKTLDNELQTDIDDALELGRDPGSFLQRAFARQPLSSTPSAKTTRRRTR